MFEIGNTIIYGSQGVCRIADIENKEIGGKVCDYYLLKLNYILFAFFLDKYCMEM